MEGNENMTPVPAEHDGRSKVWRQQKHPEELLQAQGDAEAHEERDRGDGE